MKKLFYIPVFILLLASCGQDKETLKEEKDKLVLPVIGERTFNGTDTVYHTIKNFSFIDQFRDTVTERTIEGKVYVANFFFATCQSICPRMNSQLSRVQDVYKTDDEIQLISHSINPLHDTVEVLAQYGDKFGAVRGKWHLITGNKKAIYDLAKESYLVNAVEDDGTEEGFIHSEYLILVDKMKRMRGVYDGTDSIQVNKLIEDIKLLKTEKP